MKSTSFSHPAYNALTISLLETLLQKVSHTEQFPELAVQKFLEISGAKTAVMAGCPGKGDAHGHRILAFTPERRKFLLEHRKFWEFVGFLHQTTQIQVWDSNDSQPSHEFLREMELGLSMTIPLDAGDARAGMLILFDLPDKSRAESLQNIFMAVSQVVALALRSSLLIEAQEQLLEHRSAELLDHRKSLQAFYDNRLVGMVRLDYKNRLEEANNRWLEMIGYSKGELVGESFENLMYPEDRLIRKTLMKGLIDKIQRSFQHISKYQKKNGTTFWGAFSASGIYDDKDQFVGSLGIIADVTEQKLALEQVKASEERYRLLLDSQRDFIFLHRLDPEKFGCFVEVNEAAIARYGYSWEEFLKLGPSNLHCNENFLPEELTRHHKELISKGQLIFETEHITKDGEKFPVEINASIVSLSREKYILATVRDISERRKAEQHRLELEAQLRQKYKMEAVGLMAGGIAHNFNNSLAIILGNLELASMQSQDLSESLQENLDSAKIAVMRSRDLVAQILTYSRQGKTTKTETNLAMVLDETVKLLRSTLPTTVRLDYLSPPETKMLTIKADASQIQEAILNLCNNAIQAMDEKGLLSIRLEEVNLNLADIPLQYQRKPGAYARLSIQDTGCGMSKETLGKIFDPFFTTKGMEQGTGMGLATVHGIIERHEGLVMVKSQIDQGSTFNLHFPLIEESQPLQEPPVIDELPNGTEHILFVDDEKMVAETGGQMLRTLGYQVTTMTDSLAALDLFFSQSSGFDLIMTDQTMPNMTGKELVFRAQKIKPEIATIICTGFSSKISQDQTQSLGIDAFVMKPMSLAALAKTVRQVLDKKKRQFA